MQEAETAGNTVSDICTTEGRGVWVAGGCVRPPEYSGPDGFQVLRLSNGSWEPRRYEGLEKRRRRVLSRGWRRSHRLELTTFDEGVNVRGRVNGGTCDERKVGN